MPLRLHKNGDLNNYIVAYLVRKINHSPKISEKKMDVSPKFEQFGRHARRSGSTVPFHARVISFHARVISFHARVIPSHPPFSDPITLPILPVGHVKLLFECIAKIDHHVSPLQDILFFLDFAPKAPLQQIKKLLVGWYPSLSWNYSRSVTYAAITSASIECAPFSW